MARIATRWWPSRRKTPCLLALLPLCYPAKVQQPMQHHSSTIWQHNKCIAVFRIIILHRWLTARWTKSSPRLPNSKPWCRNSITTPSKKTSSTNSSPKTQSWKSNRSKKELLSKDSNKIKEIHEVTKLKLINRTLNTLTRLGSPRTTTAKCKELLICKTSLRRRKVLQEFKILMGRVSTWCQRNEQILKCNSSITWSIKVTQQEELRLWTSLW